MQIARLLFSQGFGARRECEGLVAAGRVRVGGVVVDDPFADTEATEIEVDGRAWPVRAKALVMLHKPAGYECSQKPRHHPSVMSLLPAPLQRRGVQPVGRLDVDTTGLLLLTDDGALIHRLTSPKHHVPKVYEVTVKHPLDERQLQALHDGVVLDDHPKPVRAAAAEATGAHTLRLVLTEGKYHQVKRMLAAAGNRVEALHRSAFGALTLGGLAPSHWAWVDPAALTAPQG
ncbi:MAG: 16S rRNA pseudouridine(516) synthase [Rubrivivax sp.]